MATFEPVVPDALDILRATRGHSPGVRVGNMLLISGMLGRDAGLAVVADPEAQLAQMFDNMGLVLDEAGCGWTEVVEMTAYFTHLRRDFEIFMTVRKRYLGEPYPALTMVGVAELAQPGLICELKGMAIIPG